MARDMNPISTQYMKETSKVKRDIHVLDTSNLQESDHTFAFCLAGCWHSERAWRCSEVLHNVPLSIALPVLPLSSPVGYWPARLGSWASETACLQRGQPHCKKRNEARNITLPT